MSERIKPIPRTPPRRPLVVATGVFCLLAHALGFAHLLLVQHATCPEHDEIIHATSANGASSGRQTADTRPASNSDAVSLLPGVASSEEDDHCLVVAIRRRDTAPLASRTASGTAAGPWSPLAGPIAFVTHEVTVPLLFVAPKNSPPLPS